MLLCLGMFIDDFELLKCRLLYVVSADEGLCYNYYYYSLKFPRRDIG
jgi:hypothetical protein